MKKVSIFCLILLWISVTAFQGIVRADGVNLSKSKSPAGIIQNTHKNAQSGINSEEDEFETEYEASEGTVQKAKEGEVIPAPPVSEIPGADKASQ